MFPYLTYRRELRRLDKIRDRHDREFDAVWEKAKNGKADENEVSSVGQELREIENWIQYRQTQYLESICHDLILPLPERKDPKFYFQFNFDDECGDRFILTTAGIHYVRGLIRDEKKARREAFGFWFALTTGILGSLIGLVSVIKK
jgi:hypothetical protein